MAYNAFAIPFVTMLNMSDDILDQCIRAPTTCQIGNNDKAATGNSLAFFLAEIDLTHSPIVKLPEYLDRSIFIKDRIIRDEESIELQKGG